jgi:hypothetical protein
VATAAENRLNNKSIGHSALTTHQQASDRRKLTGTPPIGALSPPIALCAEPIAIAGR